ncbi:DUF3298 domain-containing protein [Hymenobacter negativus]|uniref:DUF3298 domain-containing protein n=1 Tax=Hymenobacter negativus TaxID=2795026 RepID=A0ABS3QN50_9BACT|nr:DUF3298 domain-containing protein [Hymenobacter negativus]MBO2012709.1 DUF3298 domain-containing protein [Hymenobacter negativus]
MSLSSSARLSAVLLLALAGCQSKTKQPDTAVTKAAASKPVALPGATTPATSYETYRGRFAAAADSFTLHLTRVPVAEEFEAEGLAAYYYGSDGQVHELRERSNPSPDSLLLGDSGPTSPDQPEKDYTWHLHREANGSWTGTRAGQPLQLQRVSSAPDGLGFSVVLHVEKILAFPSEPNSPYAELNLQGLVPTGPAANTPANQLLAANILRSERGDTSASMPAPASLEALWRSQRQAYIRTYRADAADLRPAPGSSEEEMPRYALTYQQRSTANVMVHQPPLLSLAFPLYEYQGGNRGHLTTRFRSYDLRSGRVLSFDDVFLPGTRAQLVPVLEQHLRKELGLSATEPLEGGLMAGKMPVSTNICLTPGGVLFGYEPNAVAAEHYGAVTLFVPLAELRPLLREDLPLPASSVAVR